MNNNNNDIEIPNSTITRDTRTLSEMSGNLYESVAIISKRANQISSTVKEELVAKLEEFASDHDNLEEILREMEFDMNGGDDMEYGDTESEKDAELEEAYRTIRVLKTTINEVNLLNAKLLYANKVFRQYNLTTEQKRKIVESFDRTGTVREVKLVFATISESMKLTGTTKIKKITEGFASKTTKSTAPKGIINEDVDFGMSEFQKRNKELAGIIRK
jgi:DNA-directed RNA polymerase subunit K/omega